METRGTTGEETTSYWFDLPIDVAEFEEKLGVGAESGEYRIIEKVLPFADEVHEHTKAGISLPRTAQAQYDATQHLPLSQAKAGDLVFFHSTYNAGSYVTHVGIYVGNNQMYHAGDPIGYADLSSSYWQQHLIGAGRVKQ